MTMPKKFAITDEYAKMFPIQPQEIDMSRRWTNSPEPLSGAFDNKIADTEAQHLVIFMQQRGKGWAPFTRTDIDVFCLKKNIDGLTLDALVASGWLLKKGVKYFVYSSFAARCYGASPVIPKMQLHQTKT